ncbi:hypothetical protein BS78_09G092900 [Paspalum vaginatum]|nr:hypothetical protein BS78_09G092900 [Paspalum vaginatum]
MKRATMLCSFSWSRLMPTYITTLAQVKKESVLTYRLENGHIRRPTKGAQCWFFRKMQYC